MYVSAQTGTGKTELALSTAVVLLKAISAHLRQIHAVYLSPTRQLARQVEDRFAERFGHLASAELPSLQLRSVSGNDADKKQRVKEIFDVFRSHDQVMLATNPQFLASLATKHMQFYGLPPRSGFFQLATNLALANIIILDEPHFYTGKSLVRLLTVLLAILRYKTVHGHQPTILLFISATMQVPELDSLLSYLHTQCDLNDAPLVNEAEVPLAERRLELDEGERGEKWSLLQQVATAELELLVRETAKEAATFTVVYWDNIPGLLKLQAALRTGNTPAAVLHAQMPESLQRQILEKKISTGLVRILLASSIAEVGIEFERYGIQSVDRMVSVNAQSVAKTVQRWGRLARRKDASGVFIAADLPTIRTSVARLLENGIREFGPRERGYPSLLGAAAERQSDYFSAYRSPEADLAFARSVAKAIDQTTGEVPAIYLGSSFEVIGPQPDERLSLPLGRLSAGYMQVEGDFFLEFWRSPDGLRYTLHEGQLRSAPEPLLQRNVVWDQRAGQLPASKLPAWCRQLGVKRAILGRASIGVTMPMLQWGMEFCSPTIAFVFPLGRIEAGRAFLSSPTYLALADAFEPATEDLDLIVRSRDDEIMVYVYERAAASANPPGSVGAVEFVWSEVLGAVT